MRSDRSGSILVAAIAVLFAACTGPDTLSDPATSFTATLTPDQEVTTPLTTTGSGTATLTLEAGDEIGWNVTYTALSGEPTDAHIHLGDAGSNGAAVVTLCTGGCGASPITGQDTPDTPGDYDDIVAEMRSFGAYVNLHTTENAAGEVRGQIFGVF